MQVVYRFLQQVLDREYPGIKDVLFDGGEDIYEDVFELLL